MKKGIYIFALLIAALALLANITIPHHHHDDEICFTDYDDHDHSDCDDPGHKSTDCDHDAERPEDHHNCLMDLEIILPPHQDRSPTANIIYPDEHSDNMGNSGLLIKQLEIHQIHTGVQISHSPLILLFYSQSVSGPPGLRAPPSC